MAENDGTSAQGDSTTFNNELKGALFVNDKGDNPNRPDYRGRCTIEGRDFKISGWKRQAKSDNRVFLSLSFTEEVAPPPGDIGF